MSEVRGFHGIQRQEQRLCYPSDTDWELGLSLGEKRREGIMRGAKGRSWRGLR